MTNQSLAERHTLGRGISGTENWTLPRAPRTVAETAVDTPLLVDLCAKILSQRGRLKVVELSRLLRLPPSVVGELLDFMRTERLVGVVGHPGVESEALYELTDTGRRHALDALARCQYAGPAPVSLDAYRDRVSSHSMQHERVNADSVHAAFRNIVIKPQVVDQMGAAMNSGRAVLIYGPAGSGKTYLAEHLAALQSGDIPVPYAITVGGEIIQVFDPLVHEPVPEMLSEGLIRDDSDTRWLRCRRPMVIAGGELTLQMLDLQFDPATRYYQAPPHVKANGGLFVVDDLGRQIVAPRDLMNRWIVPLDRNRDYLTLHTGFKFAIPFDMVVIFSTNLRPADLADEAFLRRFGYKVYLGAMDRTSYCRVFEEACQALDVPFDAAVFEWLVDERHLREGRELLACYPRDLVGRIRDFATYEGMEARFTRDALDRAWNTYFYTAGATTERAP